jgi:hypothetical protein
VGQLHLWYDRGSRRFKASLSIAVADPTALQEPSLESATPAEWVVDTGSNITVLSEELARRAGVDIPSLSMGDLRGAAGVAKRPFVRNVTVFVDPESGQRVRLPLVAIAKPDVARDRRAMLPASWKGSLRGGPVNILGMDLARALRARLSLDYGALKGTLEW